MYKMSVIAYILHSVFAMGEKNSHIIVRKQLKLIETLLDDSKH